MSMSSRHSLSKRDYPSDSEKILKIEEDRLQLVLNRVEEQIKQLRKSMPYQGVGMYSTGIDHEDISNLQYQKAENAYTCEQIAEMERYKDQPYFARMDFVHEDGNAHDAEVMYIGKKELYLDGEFFIYDWRSPLGQRYYIKSETHFSYNKFMYRLFLRRAINIKHGEIDNFYDEYFDPSVFGGIATQKATPKFSFSKQASSVTPTPTYKKETVDYAEITHRHSKVEEISARESARQRELDSLSWTITDPFLRQVLSEKRAGHQLTDIIRTIQENQNDIIRLPIAKNLIVQGCAGSGKTMILLHRLSYLKFNNPNLTPDRIKIITPNNLFDMHIDNLSKELELDKIQRLTMEDYYRQLLSNYDKHWEALTEGDVEPESSLDQNFINHIYSLDFASSMKTQFELWTKTLPDAYQELLPICVKYGIRISWEDSFDTKGRVSSILNSISKTRKVISKSLKKAQKDTAITEIRRNKLPDEIHKAENTLTHRIASLRNFVVVLQFRIITSLQEEVSNLQEQIDKIDGATASAHVPLFKRLLNPRRYDKTEEQRAKREGLLAKKAEIQSEIVDKRMVLEEEKQKLAPIKQALDMLGTESSHAQLDAIDAIIKTKSGAKTKDHHIRDVKQAQKELRELETEYVMTDIEQMKEDRKRLKSIENDADLQKAFSTVYLSSFGEEWNAVKEKYCGYLTRAKLYAMLIFCYLLYGKATHSDYLLCIDEGQDISLYEYEMLRKVNRNVTINVYGDVNQLIKEGRGLKSWDKLQSQSKAEIYELNENYRNSIEINEYCNKVFRKTSTSIGVSCGVVETYSGIRAALQILDANEERIALIVKSSDDAESNDITALAKTFKFAKNNIVPGQISLLTVEQAKGLEFDTVVAVPACMTTNEKYVAFTRALNHLKVVVG